MLTPTQLEERRNGVGGSEIAAILGLHPFAGPLDVYLSKVDGWQQPMNEDMERGTFLEQGIADWYQYRYKAKLDTCGTVWHATQPHVLATPDRLAFGGDIVGDERLVSIKAPRYGGEAWGPDWSGDVPPAYIMQLNWESAILASLGRRIDPMFHLAALVDGDLRVYRIERDVELQADLLKFAAHWWQKHVAARVPPPLDGSDTAAQWLRRRFPKNVEPVREAEPRELAMVERFLEAEAAYDKAEAAYDEARQFIEEAIGSASGISGPFGTITWKANKHGTRSLRVSQPKGAKK